jgi:hypothetical protein
MKMQTRILKYLTIYKTLSTEQYGFRIGLKTDNAIYKLTAMSYEDGDDTFPKRRHFIITRRGTTQKKIIFDFHNTAKA